MKSLPKQPTQSWVLFCERQPRGMRRQIKKKKKEKSKLNRSQPLGQVQPSYLNFKFFFFLQAKASPAQYLPLSLFCQCFNFLPIILINLSMLIDFICTKLDLHGYYFISLFYYRYLSSTRHYLCTAQGHILSTVQVSNTNRTFLVLKTKGLVSGFEKFFYFLTISF